ncbi:O-antigen ligase family protein [Saccharospirillum salsuginis]|uniref:O-antigen ligase-related domain-containing protein n=1 Tax=Saccharospirillum salsuginis TaxID=418750 RepID=A0A918NE39_9GAMM|nr:O-antigen ligase family protein [Saccharospirillum salsuginis]GGX60378.1 hypothetical protein GCM10007392_30500 [Saccharospirillum salsuginis]
MTVTVSQAPQYSSLPMTDVNRWFPSTWDRGPNWLVWLGIASSFIAIFIKLWTPISINRIPEALYTLPFFFALYKNFHWLKKDRIIQLFFAALLWPVIAFGIHYLQDPETALEYRKMDNLARLFLFVPIAWWLGGNTRTLGWYLTTAFSGLLLACLLDPNLPATLTALAQGKRVDFNILNAQHVALYFSIAFIGLLSVTQLVISSTKSVKDTWKPLLYVAGLIICIAVVLGTQTRAAWLALMACAGIWIIQLGWRYRYKKPGGKFLISVLIFTSISGFIGYQFSDTVVKRIQTEQGTLNHIISGDWENIPYTSIGIRINTWIEATRWIADKPVTGWGGNVRKVIIDQAERFPEWVRDRFGHFHNSYLEFSLAYGLVGLLLLLGVFTQLLWRINRLDHTSPQWIKTFSIYSIALLLVMNFFESYFFFWSGIYVITVTLVIPYAAILSQQTSPDVVKNKPFTHSSQG